MNIYNVRRRAISDYGKAAATYQPHRPELERLEPRILLSDVLPAAASFSVGDYVRTTVNVNVRTAAGTGNPEIGDPDYPGHAPAGSVGMVLKDPVSAGGLTWWRVDWGGVGAGAGSYQGWCAESVGSTVYLENARSTSRVCGIDVSHWQGTIDWSYVAGSGHAFAFVKATEGTGFTDSRLSTNMTGGGAAGMFMGPYHFARPDSAAGDAVAEASYFVSAAGPFLSKGYVRPVLDLEDGASLGKAALSDWVRDWMDAAEAQTGVEPIIYTSADYAANYLETSLSVYDLWVAHWTYDLGVPPSTGIWSTWDFWQYSGDNIAWPGNIKGATIPGISGAVDADLFNGTRSQLAAFVIGQATEPTITSSLTLTQSAPYYVGQTIDGQFAITNWGTSAVRKSVV